MKEKEKIIKEILEMKESNLIKKKKKTKTKKIL